MRKKGIKMGGDKAKIQEIKQNLQRKKHIEKTKRNKSDNTEKNDKWTK